jgi:hypothetical protein
MHYVGAALKPKFGDKCVSANQLCQEEQAAEEAKSTVLANPQSCRHLQ